MAKILGRGLASLIPQKNDQPDKQPQPLSPQTPVRPAEPAQSTSEAQPDTSSNQSVLTAPVASIQPNPDQPRKKFSEVVLQELADSIKEHGVLQPLLVQDMGGEQYQLIAGERRLQAAKLAGENDVPILIKEVTDQQNLEIALVENIQRLDLNAMEEAKAYQKLSEDFGLSHEQIAQKVGKNRSTVSNTMRLLDLPEEVKRGLIEEQITEGHARAILADPNRERQIAIYHEIVEKKLSVRQAEQLANGKGNARTRGPKAEISPLLKTRISEIEKLVGTRIHITKKGAQGKLAFQFFSEDELESILDKLEGEER
ncbi:ParB/RepB/Spo0J family partition protein [Patescibacteria group bacterium]